MFTTKTRNLTIALVASLSFGVASVAPAVSQAQYHTICSGGVCFTHKNFTEGGVSPCVRIGEGLGKAENAVGDWEDRLTIANESNEKYAKEISSHEIAEWEGQVSNLQREAFEYGCDAAAATAPVTKPPLTKGVAKTSLLAPAS
jgi:hypothetical protein